MSVRRLLLYNYIEVNRLAKKIYGYVICIKISERKDRKPGRIGV